MLRGGGWPRRSGPRGVDVLPQNPFTLRVTLCMRAKHKIEFRFIAYNAFSVQRLRQLQITFTRHESELFKDAFPFFVNLHVDRLAENTVIARFY